MIIVGLTGGIGSGKSTVAKMFAELGIPIYDADSEAKGLMNRSKVIRRKLIALFGEKAYLKSGLNRPYLAERIFNDEALLKEMNAIVHPKVASHFKRWIKRQDSAYVIREAAILFESGTYKDCDFIITVSAPKEERIKRVVLRDKSTAERVKAIMKNQWTDDKRRAMSDFIIENTDLQKTRRQVEKIHSEIVGEKQ